ncbi:hypothetical protein DPMN_146960 [Dreissena polymorpha]|uniref:Sushi domain-containing protein n=1 Tax=Dreissena polymorpha TaxID=45954 RepID=A0A9D4F6X9_DREPO|nr:hypothetical protein DPMN_146960 [Dreissena polymorpha]
MHYLDTCSELSAPTNGAVSFDDGNATFTCDEPYCLYGSKIRACNEGQWNGTNTVCLVKCTYFVYIHYVLCTANGVVIIAAPGD